MGLETSPRSCVVTHLDKILEAFRVHQDAVFSRRFELEVYVPRMTPVEVGDLNRRVGVSERYKIVEKVISFAVEGCQSTSRHPVVSDAASVTVPELRDSRKTRSKLNRSTNIEARDIEV